MKRISVAHVTGCIDSRVGGPAHALHRLCLNLKKHEVDPAVFSFHFPYDDRKIEWADVKVTPLSFNPCGIHFAGLNPKAQKEFGATLKDEKIQIIHNLGLWIFPNQYARLAAQKLNLPLITSVRGMLEPWTLKQSSFKKKIAWLLYEKQNLKNVSVFHATSDMEADSIRHAGFKQPIAVIPNGVDEVESERKPPSVDDKRVLLFLSRIDPKKGLERLFLIWKKLAPHYPKWRLVIAGTGASDYVESLKIKFESEGLSGRVQWLGLVEGQCKNELWSHAELFILPSFSENFGNVIGESLAHGVPVITTTGTPWKEINEQKCGRWVENDNESIESALVEMLNKSAEELYQAGSLGKRWIQSQYNWNESARKMAETYRWILKMGDRPDCIRTD